MGRRSSSSIPRRSGAEIPDEVAQAFKAALKNRNHREVQIYDSDSCPGIGQCEICNAYERAVAIVDKALGIKPHELSPIDVADIPAPPMWDDRERADWARARAQHVDLARAAGIPPQPKALLTDICRGQYNIRWIERHCFVPDGPRVGEPFRLMEFQRDIIRGIYGDAGYLKVIDSLMKKRKTRKASPDVAPGRPEASPQAE
jgi:hypothetical protein